MTLPNHDTVLIIDFGSQVSLFVVNREDNAYVALVGGVLGHFPGISG